MEPQIKHISPEHLLDGTEFHELKNVFSDHKDYDLFIKLFYQECQKDRTLFTMDGKLDVTRLTMDQILKFQNHTESLVTEGKMKKQHKDLMLSYLYQLCQTLTKEGLARIYYPPPLNAKKALNPKKLNNSFPIISEFEGYMKLRNYSPKTIHDYKTSVNYFLRHASYHSTAENGNAYWREKLTIFEKKVRSKVLLEQIQLSTAYSYLKAINVFMTFLQREKKLSFPYKIPEDLIQNGKRTNEYVKMQDLKIFMETVFNTSKHVLRDICIVLILLETGCRPIEVINLRIDDLSIHEKLIVLKSKKSFQRTLSLHGMSMALLKKYLQIRKNYIAEEDVQALFLSSSGALLHRGYISQLFRKYNLKSFNQIRFTPKTLRHAFITDALNSNSAEQVRETVGHRHLISTHYYTYRGDAKYKKIFDNITLWETIL